MKRFLPLFIILAGVIAAFSLGAGDWLNFKSLTAHYQFLATTVQENQLLSLGIFMGTYVLVVAFSIPGGAIMTIAGGVLFGYVAGALSVVLSATLGATLLFLAAKTALGNALKEKAAPWFSKMQKGFQDNAFHYLLFLRLVPIFPFFVVNLVPAFLSVKLRDYFWATLLGILPGTFVFTSIGVGVQSLLEQGQELSFSTLITPQITIALGGLGVLALIPVLYKMWKKRH
ncbi:MAG: TVP38/TMEM64 family protein [bacterium]|nr:TVP38/TMEM64 family protein [bacterium]